MINWNFISCNIFIKKKIMMSYVLLLMLILYTINSEKLCKYEQNLKHKRSHLWLMRAVMVVSLQKTIHSPPKWVIIFYLSAITNIFPLFLNKTDCNIQRYRYWQDWRSSSNHFLIDRNLQNHKLHKWWRQTPISILDDSCSFFYLTYWWT